MLFQRKFIFLDLSVEDTTFYKGLAILMIIMHNFFHYLPPKIGENEQDFSLDRLERYLQSLNNIEYVFQTTLSFLGHYGVQIFLFLSAYGLTKKYLYSKINYAEFLKKRLLKIYPAFLFSIFIWAIYIGLIDGGRQLITTVLLNWHSLLYKLTLVSNFIPGELYKINGPWWFVSLIVQFYIVFPFILALFRKFGSTSLFILSAISLAVTSLLQPHVGIPLPGTILAHVPELSIGIYFAQKNKFVMKYLTIFIIMIIFSLSNLYHFFWYFSFSSALILLLVLFQSMRIKSNKIINNGILFIGSISMYIFYINGFMRQPWINYIKDRDLWYVNILVCILFILLVIAISYLMAKISERKWLNRKMNG